MITGALVIILAPLIKPAMMITGRWGSLGLDDYWPPEQARLNDH